MDNSVQYKIQKSFVVRFGKGYGISFYSPNTFALYNLHDINSKMWKL